MGHLLNPVSFRTSYFGNWLDLWSVSNQWLYAEMLHNSLACKNVLYFFFNNNLTARLGLLYSHCTFERLRSSTNLLKFYFYDGIVERKVSKFLNKFRKLNRLLQKYYRKVLRRFVDLSKKITAKKFLGIWGFYEYLLARRVVYFFLRMLKMGFSVKIKNLVLNYMRFVFIKTIGFKWRKFMFFRKWFPAKKPINLYNFIVYYLKFLLIFGLKTANQNDDVNISTQFINRVDLSGFLKPFGKAFIKWRFYINHFRCLIFNKYIYYKGNYAKYITIFTDSERFSSYFFFLYYRLYLMRFRTARFFVFLKQVILKFFKTIAIQHTDIEFFGIDNETLSSSFLARFLGYRVVKRFQVVRDLFKPISTELKHLIKKTRALCGYKLQFTGRMSRRGKVLKIIFRGGKLPLSKVTAQIDHSFYAGVIQNGTFCVRVWFFKFKNYGNYNYNASFWLRTLLTN